MTTRGVICELAVADVPRSCRFYESLGFRTIDIAPDAGTATWALLELFGGQLMLQEQNEFAAEIPVIEPSASSPRFALVLKVGDAGDASRLRSALPAGARVVKDIAQTEYGSTEFSFQDPDGHLVLISGEG